MKKHNVKIAIISFVKQDSADVSLRLSKLLNIPHVSVEDDKAIYQAIYNKASRKYSSNEVYTMILAEFHSRIEKEKKMKYFVSDGSVLNEIALIKARYKSPIKYGLIGRILQPKYKEFEHKVEAVLQDYAAKAYDQVCLIKSIHKDNGSLLFESYIEKTLENRNVKYSVITDTSDATLMNVVSNL